MSIELGPLLEEQEYDELGELLDARAGESGFQLDALHGMLTAIAVGPEPVPPDEWMTLVIDQAQPFESVEQAERTITLILRLYNTVCDDLECLRYNPILGQIETENGENTLSAHGWCGGFSRGVDLREELWDARLNDDPELTRAMAPVIELATDEGVYEDEQEHAPEPLSESEYDDALGRLPAAMYETQQYWRDHPPDVPFVARKRDPAAPPTTPRRRGGSSVH